MRPIEFRAWEKKFKYMTAHINMEHLRGGFQGLYGNNAIVMQFTGLFDKNGVKIFEGDILRYTGSYKGHGLYQIIWTDNLQFECLEINGNNYMMPTVWVEEMEIIGNIYENKELLRET